jgi:hypothetical protein
MFFIVTIVLSLSVSVQRAEAAPILSGDIFWADTTGFVFKTNADDDVTDALGEPDNLFYSLGLGGFLEAGFSDQMFDTGGVVTIYETTNGNPDNYPEGSLVFAGLLTGSLFEGVNDNNPVLGSSAQNGYSFTIPETIVFNSLLFEDVTTSVCGDSTSCSGNGFDVNAVSFEPFADVSVVPIPPSFVLMGFGLAGLGFVRKIKPKS